MSLARNSTAFSSRSLTARTTGAPLARSRRLSMSSSRGCAVSPPPFGSRSSSLQPLVEGERDVLERRDLDDDFLAKHDLRGALRGHVGRIRDREHCTAVGRLIRKDHHLAQESLRERRHQRYGATIFLQRYTLQPMKTRRFIRELAGRQIGQFPQLGLAANGCFLLGRRRHDRPPASNVCFDADVPRTAKTDRWSFVFPVRVTFFETGLRVNYIMFNVAPASTERRASNRTVIDPKCDTRTKHVA